MKAKMKRLLDFLHADIWRIRLKSLPPGKSFCLKQLRVILLALRGFAADRCGLRASALTFYTMLSIVPAVAMAFGIAKGFGIQTILQKKIRNAFEAQEQTQVGEFIINTANGALEGVRSGAMVGVGVVLLLWMVIKVLGNIEHSFNDIWGIKKSRHLGRKFADYMSIMLICPLLLVLASGATVLVNTKMDAFLQARPSMAFIAPVLMFALKVLPFGLVPAGFAFLYVFMPNTKVNLRSGLLAGVVAGLLYLAFQALYVALQVGVANANRVYGSFAALPLFLIWIQLSWLVVLFGAELSFAHQNVETYEFEPDCLEASRSFKTLLALRIAQMLVRNFIDGAPPMTGAQVSHELGVPIRLTNDILYELVDAAIVSETMSGEEKEAAHQPAVTVEKLTIGYVLDALRRRGSDRIPVVQSEELSRLADRMEKLNAAMAKSPENVLLRYV